VKALPPEEGIETWGWVGTGKLGSGVKALPPEEGIETLEPTTNRFTFVAGGRHCPQKRGLKLVPVRSGYGRRSGEGTAPRRGD